MGLREVTVGIGRFESRSGVWGSVLLTGSDFGDDQAVCAMCFQTVIPEAEMGGAVLVGEEAHIVARESDGPRGDSPLTEEQRDEYSNLVLLCPTHHTLIDKKPTGPEEYPVDRLLKIKLEHETKVFAALEFDIKAQQNEERWAKLVDDFVARIRWEAWPRLSSNLIDAGSQPTMLDSDFERLKALDQWILTRVWPEGHERLRTLIQGIGEVINQLILLFSRNAEESPLPNAQRLIPAYSKLGRWDPPEYERLLADYLYKRDLIADLVLELTRFSNAICDEIRADIDAQFRFEEGTLMVMFGPSERFEYEYLRPAFRPEDYRGRSHPYPGLESFQTERHTRDRAIGERRDDGSAL